MEVVGIVVGLLAGLTYAVFRRTLFDIRRTKEATRELRAKRNSEIAPTVLAIVALVLFLYFYINGDFS